MEYIVVDTCAIMHMMRKDLKGQQALNFLNNRPGESLNVISVATIGELRSLATQHNWGKTKLHFIDFIIKSSMIIDISYTDVKLIEAYAQIDSFSKRKGLDKNGNLKPGSSNNMGKNDLWIAATAHVLGAILLTADGDFDHLSHAFLTIEKV
jgi:tRNA(fMet)-specific endonuclease VapC